MARGRRNEGARRRKYRDRRLIAGRGKHTAHFQLGILDETCPDCMAPSPQPEPPAEGLSDAGTQPAQSNEKETLPW